MKMHACRAFIAHKYTMVHLTTATQFTQEQACPGTLCMRGYSPRRVDVNMRLVARASSEQPHLRTNSRKLKSIKARTVHALPRRRSLPI